MKREETIQLDLNVETLALLGQHPLGGPVGNASVPARSCPGGDTGSECSPPRCCP
jgi:hypothetical protein